MRKIKTRKIDGVVVVEIHGKLTFDQGAAEVRSKIRELVQDGQSKVLMNLAEVSQVDSIGVESLVSSYTTVREAGGQLKFSNLSERTLHLLEITNLLRVFETFEDERMAMASFSS